jgi:hypothetical protein
MPLANPNHVGSSLGSTKGVTTSLASGQGGHSRNKAASRGLTGSGNKRNMN